MKARIKVSLLLLTFLMTHSYSLDKKGPVNCPFSRFDAQRRSIERIAIDALSNDTPRDQAEKTTVMNLERLREFFYDYPLRESKLPDGTPIKGLPEKSLVITADREGGTILSLWIPNPKGGYLVTDYQNNNKQRIEKEGPKTAGRIISKNIKAREAESERVKINTETYSQLLRSTFGCDTKCLFEARQFLMDRSMPLSQSQFLYVTILLGAVRGENVTQIAQRGKAALNLDDAELRDILLGKADIESSIISSDPDQMNFIRLHDALRSLRTEGFKEEADRAVLKILGAIEKPIRKAVE